MFLIMRYVNYLEFLKIECVTEVDFIVCIRLYSFSLLDSILSYLKLY